jgi:hypothetical protein
LETRRITLGQKTPLLIALELKSSLYLRGGWSSQLCHFLQMNLGGNIWASWKTKYLLMQPVSWCTFSCLPQQLRRAERMSDIGNFLQALIFALASHLDAHGTY